MNRSSLLSLTILALPLAATLGACAAEPAPVTPEPPVVPTAAETAAPTAEPAATAEPSAEAAASADPGAAPTRKPSGRPATNFDSATGEIAQTCGSTPATVLRLQIKESPEPMALVVTEWALPTGYNITWKLQPKAPSGQKPQFGPMFQTIVQEAGEAAPIRVGSEGPPFEFRVPLFGKETLNLAVGEIGTDDKGKEKVTWTVFAPAKVEKGLGYALFQVPFLGHSYVHATGAAPTSAP
jgi:hypothetical protein